MRESAAKVEQWEAPGEDALPRRSRLHSETWSILLDGDTRARIEAVIEGLITVLDHADGDADLEDGHDAEAVNENGDPLDQGEFDEAEAAERSGLAEWPT